MECALPRYTGDSLIQCAHSGDVEGLDAVVGNDIDVSYRTKRGTSVLHAAAISVDEKMMLHLLKEHPVCVKSGMLPDKKGFNALHHWCARHGGVVVFDKLIDAGFDAKEKTHSGQTALDLARETRNEDLVKHIVDYLKGPVVLPPLHKCILNGGTLESISMIENNKGADVMKRASNQCTEIPNKLRKTLPPWFTPMELAIYLENCPILPMLVKYTDNHIIEKCLKISSGKTKEAIVKGITQKLHHEHKPEHVVFGTLRDPLEHVFVVFSKNKTHGAETSIAGYRVLFHNPIICEKDGIDEGRVVLHHCHKHDYFLSETEKVLIDKAINQECDKLWTKHSNIRGIMSSPVRYSKGKFLLEPCVVILCLFKSFIPEKEPNFPINILVDGKFVPVDVREGYFRLLGDNNPLAKHVPLTMGCKIETNDGTARFGTLGPFVQFQNKLCCLLPAHVMFSEEECREKAKEGKKKEAEENRSLQKPAFHDAQYRQTKLEDVTAQHGHGLRASKVTERLMLQPGQGPDVNPQEHDQVCGKVIKWDYAMDRETSIDIAVVEITDQRRIPRQGRFTAYDKQQFKRIGYSEWEPTFDTGKKGNPTCTAKTDEEAKPVPAEAKRQRPDHDERTDHRAGNNIIIFGGASGPTIGKYRKSSNVQFTVKQCGKTEANEIYRGIHYIDNSQCGEPDCKLPNLAQGGDSGAGAFQRLDDKSLVCIGVLVAVDNTGSALVTPIDPVLNYFDLKMKDFKRSQPQ